MTDAQKTAIDAAKGNLGAVKFDGNEYPILKRVNTLQLSELARTEQGDPESFAILAEIFETSLGKATYRKLRKDIGASDIEDADEAIMESLQQIIEAQTGRPTD